MLNISKIKFYNFYFNNLIFNKWYIFKIKIIAKLIFLIIYNYYKE